MKKNEYCALLEKSLRKLKEKDRREVVEYYDELIIDRIEDGQNEEEVVASLPDPIDAANEAIRNQPLAKRMKARFSTGNIGIDALLVILLFPFWLPCLIVFFTFVGLSYIFTWLIPGIVALVSGSLLVYGFMCSFASLQAYQIEALYGLFGNGVGLAAIGLGILLGLTCIFLFPLAVKITKLLSKIIKKLFVKEVKINE